MDPAGELGDKEHPTQETLRCYTDDNRAVPSIGLQGLRNSLVQGMFLICVYISAKLRLIGIHESPQVPDGRSRCCGLFGGKSPPSGLDI